MDRKTMAYEVAGRAADVVANIRGFCREYDRDYLEKKLAVLADRMPRWNSAQQIEWKLVNTAAAEVKTHFVLDSDDISEMQIWNRIWEGIA